METKQFKRVIPITEIDISERFKITAELRMYRNNDGLYLAELPLVSKEAGVVGNTCYIFSELTPEEQAKYFDKSILVPVTSEEVRQIYEEDSKRIFPKRKVRKPKNIEEKQ